MSWTASELAFERDSPGENPPDLCSRPWRIRPEAGVKTLQQISLRKLARALARAGRAATPGRWRQPATATVSRPPIAAARNPHPVSLLVLPQPATPTARLSLPLLQPTTRAATLRMTALLKISVRPNPTTAHLTTGKVLGATVSMTHQGAPILPIRSYLLTRLIQRHPRA